MSDNEKLFLNALLEIQGYMLENIKPWDEHHSMIYAITSNAVNMAGAK